MASYNDFERVFNECDVDGDGKISSCELRHCVATISGELSWEEVEVIVKGLDSDGDGLLGLDEFVGLMEFEGGEEKVKDLREVFGMYVMDGCEYITPESLMRMLGRLGESRTVDECMVMIDQFDLNGDGMLNFDEFMAMMHL